MSESSEGTIKICGLGTAADAVFSAEQGADALGFIFAPSRRRVTPEAAGEMIAAGRSASPSSLPVSVGVFVEPSIEEILEVIEVAGIDRVQLHGSGVEDLAEQIPVPVIRALGPKPGSAVLEVEEEIRRYPSAIRFQVDGYDPVQHGGRGTRADWTLVAKLAQKHPIVLAGGLEPANVGEAIRLVRPVGVDVSSGVERNGQKDHELIAAFIGRARAAFRNLSNAEN